jgi:NADH:ubiquinone oxidoreductase subunit 4 (subunit M)
MIKLIFLLLVFIPIVIICLLFLFPYKHKVLSLLGANTLLFLSITLLFFYLSDYEVAVTTTQTSRSFFENGALYLIEFKYFGYYIFDISFLAFVFGFDFLNINLIILMNFIFLISFYYNIYTIKSHNYIFSILLFSLSTILVLLFCTFNIFLFYLLFEISLLPLFFIIGI